MSTPPKPYRRPLSSPSGNFLYIILVLLSLSCAVLFSEQRPGGEIAPPDVVPLESAGCGAFKHAAPGLTDNETAPPAETSIPPDYDLARPFETEPVLAIVIDDMGENLPAANFLCKLDFPVALSVWPLASRAAETAQIAHRAGREVMIHIPMQPIGYPRKNPGLGALLEHMNQEELRLKVLELISHVPYAVGLNNHMGSQLTCDKKAMSAICQALMPTGLFVLDSRTHSDSALYNEARKNGLRALKRDVFLDHHSGEAHVFQQLRMAEQIALKHGMAIAIGHPLADTLRALAKWGKVRDRQVRVAPISRLLKPPTP